MVTGEGEIRFRYRDVESSLAPSSNFAAVDYYFQEIDLNSNISIVRFIR